MAFPFFMLLPVADVQITPAILSGKHTPDRPNCEWSMRIGLELFYPDRTSPTRWS